MPVYVYLCQDCDRQFEKMQRFSEDPLTVCPHCGGTVQRVIQPVGVIFKGSGFYVTDNRGKSSTMTPTRPDSGGGEGDGGTAGPAAKPAETPSKPDAAGEGSSAKAA